MDTQPTGRKIVAIKFDKSVKKSAKENYINNYYIVLIFNRKEDIAENDIVQTIKRSICTRSFSSQKVLGVSVRFTESIDFSYHIVPGRADEIGVCNIKLVPVLSANELAEEYQNQVIAGAAEAANSFMQSRIRHMIEGEERFIVLLAIAY